LADRDDAGNGKGVERNSTSRTILGALASLITTAAAVFAAWLWLGAPVTLPPVALSSAQKLYCVSYAPFRGAQDPLVEGTRVEAWQIDEDFAFMARYSNCARTYSVDDGLDHALASARRYGVKVLAGIWVSGERERTRRQVAAAVELIKQYPDVVIGVVVGNEVLLRGEMSPADLIAVIRSVKSQVAVPVTYADVWEFWLRYPDVQSAVDFVTVHILPYWEDFPIPANHAADHVAAIRAKVAAAFPGKEIVIGEFGWPSAGRPREGALPSPSNQARAITETLALAQREHFRVNIIEAFDQPWKRALEGAAGGYWGIFDRTTNAMKFSLNGGVSDHPYWLSQALAGIALAVLAFGAAFAASGWRPERVHWRKLALTIVVPAILIGWIAEEVLVEGFSVGSWLRTLSFAAIGVASPLVCAAASAAGRAQVPFAALLAGSGARRDWLDWLIGATLIALTAVALENALGLVFDPRYRDIPFAPLIGATAPFLAMALWSERPQGRRATAETVAAAVLAVSAGYIVINETFANWQSVLFGVGLLGLAIILVQARVAPDSK
jgi:glucan 1,3-beta-glucosidase